MHHLTNTMPTSFYQSLKTAVSCGANCHNMPCWFINQSFGLSAPPAAVICWLLILWGRSRALSAKDHLTAVELWQPVFTAFGWSNCYNWRLKWIVWSYEQLLHSCLLAHIHTRLGHKDVIKAAKLTTRALRLQVIHREPNEYQQSCNIIS